MSAPARPRPGQWPRRLCLALLACLATTSARADATVPIDLQVDLLRKLVRFERGFTARSKNDVSVLIVVRSNSTSSARVAGELSNQLERVHDLIGKPLRVRVHPFTSVNELKVAALNMNAQLLMVTPGFDGEIAGIASAFDGVPIITVTTDGEEVARGIVVGFELVASRPKIYLNLGQARRQGLDFSSDLFRLARVFQ